MKILQVDGLKTYFYTAYGIIKAVDGVNFDIENGEVFGLVGESGSGKTLTALSILKLIPYPGRITGGSILFNGEDLAGMSGERLRSIRGSRISIVFQEPSTALNPVFTVGYQVSEAILAHRVREGERDPERPKNLTNRKILREAKDLAMEYLDKVHIPQVGKVFYDYPHQISGGTKQRVMIAMALVNSPDLLILDEPTTALDVTIQAQILDLLDEVIEKEKMSVLFISHDFGVVARMCGRVAVMHKGRVVEAGVTDKIMSDPQDQYTASLLESVKALL